MEFEIEESFKTKIDLIIEKDLNELFGDEKEGSSPEQVESIISPKKPEIKTALPLDLYDILINMDTIAGDNPYNRLLTAIEIFEQDHEQELFTGTAE